MDPELDEALSLFTDEELTKELERREQIRPVVPEPLHDIDLKYLEQLRAMAHTHLQSFIDPEVRSKDTEHYMYEATMQMFYGPEIFEAFINPHLR